MATISQMTCWNTFSWMKIFAFRLKFHWSLFLRVQMNNIPALVQIMAWRRPGDKPLSEPMMVSLPTHICVTRPQWVKNAFCLISLRCKSHWFFFYECRHWMKAVIWTAFNACTHDKQVILTTLLLQKKLNRFCWCYQFTLFIFIISDMLVSGLNLYFVILPLSAGVLRGAGFTPELNLNIDFMQPANLDIMIMFKHSADTIKGNCNDIYIILANKCYIAVLLNGHIWFKLFSESN